MRTLLSVMRNWINKQKLVFYLFRRRLPYSLVNKIQCEGLPILQVYGILSITDKITLVNDDIHSVLGKNNRCKLLIYPDATLSFKGKCGMSNVVIVATKCIEIGRNVLIGGGCTIVDCDFHSMNYNDWYTPLDEKHMISKPVTIGDNVFIGMNCIILKGVTIGNGAVIAAGSVVSRDIPENEIWGGNPAKYIKDRKVY